MDTVEKYHRYVNTSALAGIEPITIESARGATVTATDGTEYTDLYSGIGVVNAGHVPPKVAEAAKRQMDKIVHSCSYVYHVPVVADLAERLAHITPGRLQKTFFGNSGAEAVEGALRLARVFTGKREIIALQGSFHGRTAGALAVTGNSLRKHHGGAQIAGIAFAPTPNPYRCRMCSGKCSLACADAVDDVIRYDTSDDVAAFIVEPIIGEGGIIPLPEGYLTRVKEILDAKGILLIADEVQSGFARSGHMFAIEAYDVEPDIMTMAKGIASGFPLGAFIARDDVADAFEPGDHMTTFGGNPVSCAAGVATIDMLVEEHLPERAARLGSMVMSRLDAFAVESDLIGDVRGAGLMIGVELVRDRETKEPATTEAAAVKRHCRERGVLIGVGGAFGNVVRVQPPLVIDEEDLDRALRVIEEAVTSLAATPVG